MLKLNIDGSLAWQKTIGGSANDEMFALVELSDTSFIAAGQSSSTDGDITVQGRGLADYWIVKLNATGEIQWQRKYGGTKDDVARDIIATKDGGFICIGETYSDDGDVTVQNGVSDCWVIKLNEVGEMEWQKSFGSIGTDYGTKILETIDGYVVCGYGHSINGYDNGWHGLYDVWVMKLNFEGEIIWAKAFGGSHNDYGWDTILEPDGSIIIAASTKSQDGNVVGNNGILVAWVLKLDSEGKLLWQKTIGGTEGDAVKTICHAHDQGYILGGYTWSIDGDLTGLDNRGESDAWLFKLAPESTSITHASTHHLELFPNPATLTVFLNTPQYEESLQTLVTDLSGRELYRQQVNSFDGLEVSSLSKGVYLVEAIGEGGVRYVGKLLKQ
jgi:hypothetical protein